MAAIRRTVEIAAPTGRVWALIDDERNIPRWMPEVVETSYPAGIDRNLPIGTRFRQRIREGGRVKEYEGEVTAYEAGRLLGIRLGDGRHFAVDVTYRIGPGAAGGTRLDYACDLEMKSWLARIMSVIARPLTNRILDRHMARLKAVAEGSDPLPGRPS